MHKKPHADSIRHMAVAVVLTIVSAVSGASDEPQPIDEAYVDAESAAREVLFKELRSPHDNVRWVALRAATELRDPWVAEAALPMCDSPDILEQVLALELLANTDASRGTEQFLAALQSSDRAVRLRGLLGLELVGDPATAPDIARHVTDDVDPDLRAAAARALGTLDEPATVPSLYSAVGDSHTIVRRAAVQALVEIGDTDVGRYLVSRLQRSRQFELLPLLRLLTLVRDPTLVPELRPYLGHELDEVRAWAAAAILAALETRDSMSP